MWNVESLIWRVLSCKPGSSSFALWPMDIDPRVHASMPTKTNDIVEFEIGDFQKDKGGKFCCDTF